MLSSSYFFRIKLRAKQDVEIREGKIHECKKQKPITLPIKALKTLMWQFFKGANERNEFFEKNK